MAKEYREILRKYQRRQKEIHPSYRDYPLYNYALEEIVPHIWMDLGFADELVDVIFRTSDSIENKIQKIHREVQKIEDTVRQQSIFSLDRRAAFRKAMLIATSWAGKYPGMLQKAGLHRTAEIARGLNTHIKFNPDLVDRKPMRDFATTWGAFDQFAYPPYPVFHLKVPFNLHSPDQEKPDIVSVVIEENPTKHLDLSDFPKLSKSSGVLSNMRAIALHHVFGRRKPIEARYRAFFFLNGIPFPYCAYYINGVGSVMKPFGRPNEDHHEEAQGYCAHLAFRVELILTLLNTRNSPFTDFRDAELDRKKEQIKTMTDAERKAYLLRLRKRNASLGEVNEKIVTIDLAPLRKQQRFRNMSNRQIMDIIRRHFVRAHFKWLKEKGPTLWKFHLRGKNKPGETDADLMAREANVIASNPATPLETPDGRLSFGRAIRQKKNAPRRIKGRNSPRPGR